MRRKGLLGWGGERRNTHRWFYMIWEECRGQRLYVGVTTDQVMLEVNLLSEHANELFDVRKHLGS